MIDREAFEAWRDNIVTQEVFQALNKAKQRAKDHWMTRSWDSGEVDPVLLADLRARYQAIEDLTDLTYDELAEELDDTE